MSNKERYHYLKALGICTRCGKQPARPNRASCESCSTKEGIQSRKWYSKEKRSFQYKALQRRDKPQWLQNREQAREDAIAIGLCATCKKEPLVQGLKTCKFCTIQRRLWTKEWREEHKEHVAELQKQQRIKLREQVINAYGGWRCVCCGYNKRKECIQIDHINNNGSAHRKEIGESAICRWLIKNNFPPEFQILCANCNTIKKYLGRCTCQE